MTLELPSPDASGRTPFADCIQGRRSVREYSEAPIAMAHLAQLLWSAQGITGSDRKRAVPSAGALYPLHLCVVARRVTELEQGIYEYDCDRHSLRLLECAESDGAAVGIGDQPWLNDCAVVIGIAARLEDAVEHFSSQPPVGERGSRYVYLEAGALAQNVLLQATDVGLGGVLVAGFDDSRAKQWLRLPATLHPIALLCIGHPRVL